MTPRIPNPCSTDLERPLSLYTFGIYGSQSRVHSQFKIYLRFLILLRIPRVFLQG
jgi:hypothetical protein